ncbi:hypothetical protein [Saccharopolyspora rosea]|uniref:Uncharacterized protein n=1 Tax=Saccharopolyspora rosea TaxID=524884 RepID=A0ABW3FUX5_9PSEU|nr:hypothetical protein [Saccharopolyspora rosea]
MTGQRTSRTTSSDRRTRSGNITTSVTRDFGDFRDVVSASFVPLEVTSGQAGSFWGREMSRSTTRADRTPWSSTSASSEVPATRIAR